MVPDFKFSLDRIVIRVQLQVIEVVAHAQAKLVAEHVLQTQGCVVHGSFVLIEVHAKYLYPRSEECFYTQRDAAVDTNYRQRC